MAETPPSGPRRRTSSQFYIPQATGMSTRTRWMQLAPWFVGVSLLLLALGFLTRSGIERALKVVLGKYLKAVIEADKTALTIWMENEKQMARRWARNDFLLEQVEGLIGVAVESRESPEALLQSRFQAELRELLGPDKEEKEILGFLVLDRAGLILASDGDARVGLRLTPTGLGILGRALERGTDITHPFRISDVIASAPQAMARPLMLTASSVLNDEDAPIAVLGFLIDPEEDFTRIISVAKVGDAGHTYAFNGEGVLLSDSPYEEELGALGLLPGGPGAESILNLRIRNPGRDLTRGRKPRVPFEELPLTRMAAAAISGRDGMDLEGYRDFRGVKVVGAWRWLHDYDFGIATEVSLEEVLHVTWPLTLAYWILFGALVVLALAVLSANTVIYWQRRRLGEIQRVDRYTLEEKIAVGGNGTIYLARHALLRRPTAVKLLRSDRVSSDTLVRFEREVQLTSQLSHPNTIEIYDYGHGPKGTFYYAMEYLHGITLADLIEIEGALPPERAVFILRQICASLGEAHELELVHRDIKPMNIMLCRLGSEDDFVKVLDFGLVKQFNLPADAMETGIHQIPGTPLYTAPERLRDPSRVDARADIYSLGVVGFNLLTGKDPFEGGGDPMETAHIAMHAPAPRPSEMLDGPIPPALDDLIAECMRKDPDERPSDMGQVIGRLDALRFESAWNRTRARRWWEERAGTIESLLERKREEANR